MANLGQHATILEAGWRESRLRAVEHPDHPQRFMNGIAAKHRELGDAIETGDFRAPAIEAVFQAVKRTLDALSNEFAAIPKACAPVCTMPFEKCDFPLRGAHQNVIIP
jgi:hypothetical protein